MIYTVYIFNTWYYILQKYLLEKYFLTEKWKIIGCIKELTINSLLNIV